METVPFVTLMRRYCIDYTARHDLTVCDDIMDPGYTLHMGEYDLSGRDDAYKPAAAAQFRQFPGLCLTVNEIVCSGARLAQAGRSAAAAGPGRRRAPRCRPSAHRPSTPRRGGRCPARGR